MLAMSIYPFKRRPTAATPHPHHAHAHAHALDDDDDDVKDDADAAQLCNEVVDDLRLLVVHRPMCVVFIAKITRRFMRPFRMAKARHQQHLNDLAGEVLAKYKQYKHYR